MRVRTHWFELALLGVIVAVAAWLRLRQLGLMEFKADEALAVRIGRDIIHGDFRTVGLTSSAGAKNPPLFVYLAALPLLVRDDPRSAAAFVAITAVAAVALLYLVLRPRFGALAALSAAALLATAPWAVLYGRKLWAQDFLPIVTVGLLWSLFVLLERSRTRWVVLVPLLLSLAVQLNFSALALAVPVVVAVLYRRRHVHWPAFLIGVGVSLVLLGPWLAHNAKHHFTDFVSLAKEGRGNGGSSTPGEGLVEAVRQTVHLVSAEGWSFVMGASKNVFVDEAGAAWTLGRIAGFAVVVGLLAGIVSCAIRVVRRTPPDVDAARRALLLVWLLGIWLSYATSAKDRVQPHYLIASFPVSFALVGVGLRDGVVLARGRRAAQIAAIAAVGCVCAAFVAFTLSFQHFLDRHGGTAGDYGVIYRDELALARAAQRQGLNVADDAMEFLATGSLMPPPGTTRFVVPYNRLKPSPGVHCLGRRQTFGAIVACFPLPAATDRAAWRSLLHWPESCESAWKATGTTGAGLSLYPARPGTLVAVQCAPGAYQGDAMLFLVGGEGRIAGPLVADLYRDPGNGRPRLGKATVVLGELRFDRATSTLTVFDKARGIGDCGIYSRYRLAGGRLALIEARAKTDCDGKPPFDPTRWPKLPSP
jgi:4-amino-4-deoxy-L-arabinose transferase-like glycosyltransferase